MDILPLIRDYRSADYSSVLKVWGETGMGGAARGDDEHTINHTLSSGGRLLVMETDHEIIGTSWITDDGRRLYLHHFGIRPAWQGRGWAKPLLKASLEWVKSRGMQVKLEVHRTNVRAIGLYSQSGFNYLGDYDVYIIRTPEDIEI